MVKGASDFSMTKVLNPFVSLNSLIVNSDILDNPLNAPVIYKKEMNRTGHPVIPKRLD